jgi:hypothetical protein
MKNLDRACLPFALFAAIAIFACGCGSSTKSEVTSSEDELTQYLNEHPELKDVPEDTVNESGL